MFAKNEVPDGCGAYSRHGDRPLTEMPDKKFSDDSATLLTGALRQAPNIEHVGIEVSQLLFDNGIAGRILQHHAAGLEYLQKVGQRRPELIAITMDRVGTGTRRHMFREKVHNGTLADCFQVIILWVCYRILAQECWPILAHPRSRNRGSPRSHGGPFVDWKAKVELFEQLRREHEFGIGTIAGVAAKFGVHRRVVRRAIASALPPRQHYPERTKPKLGAGADFIEQVLDEDRRAPRKQRHTARRIHRRILTEFPGAAVAESMVRNHVRERERQMGLGRRETFVPQSYGWAQEAQVDWYEAWVDLRGEQTRMQVFAMRSMASGAAFHRACRHATQQAFLEAHEQAFAYFGGVFNLLRYDNLASAVRKIMRGHRREETVRFMAFRSHWRFTAEFRTPGEGHEKGGTEGEGGYFRRNHLVRVPCVADVDAFNPLLLTACRADEARILAGRSETIGAAMAVERGHLLSGVTEGFDLAEEAFPLVDKQGCATVKTNYYSVPVRAGARVEARVHPSHVEIWHAGRRVARHERCYSRRHGLARRL